MLVGVPRESYPNERRVALVPGVLPALSKAGHQVLLEAGAGVAAGYPDAAYVEKGARLAADRAGVFRAAEAILQVRGYGANPRAGRADLALLRRGQALIGLLDPLTAPREARELAATGVTAFALELMPRITRAQSMDVLSSMATVAGYKAVLLAAGALPKMFPMLMTAAGTITPARVFVVGAGVAGLQAVATARRLGAVVEAYDVRPAAREQVESLGARFVALPVEAGQAEDRGGYATAQDDAFYRRQREAMREAVAQSDVVITTAVVPGRRAPVLITADMVARMAQGSVIVDLAAERGGNCDLTRPDETVVAHGVTILGPSNLPSDVPFHASQMFSRNVTAFLLHLTRKGGLQVAPDDPIAAETLLARDGEVVHLRIREALGMAAAATAAPAGSASRSGEGRA
jgi:NAD(P) transhydrogenase subunit alpha